MVCLKEVCFLPVTKKVPCGSVFAEVKNRTESANYANSARLGGLEKNRAENTNCVNSARLGGLFNLSWRVTVCRANVVPNVRIIKTIIKITRIQPVANIPSFFFILRVELNYIDTAFF